MNSKRPRLVPARPDVDAEEAAAYMPRVPWRWILLGTLSVATVGGGYWLKEQRKADALRSQIIRVHEAELAEPARIYGEFRERLEGWIIEAGEHEPEQYIDERLNISGLRAGKGLYLRLRAGDAKDTKSIAKGAAKTTNDVIASCLGLSPASASGLWTKGKFLAPDWIDGAREGASVMDLRVTDEMLANRIEADLPAVLNMVRSDWFMLVLQHGETRREEPVDVFLWDIRSGQQLLAARIQATGVLLPVRIRSKDAPRAPALPKDRLEGAGGPDCSIAAQIKELSGRGMAQIENVPEHSALAENKPGDGGAGDTP